MAFGFFALLFLLVLITSNFSIFVVSGSSMEPSIGCGDIVICLNNSFRMPLVGEVFKITDSYFSDFFKPRRGDIICFTGFLNSDLSNELILKRLIGLSYDFVHFDGSSTFINGIPTLLSVLGSNLQSESLCLDKRHRVFATFCIKSSAISDSYSIKVPRDHYLILGDNRDTSLDSRLYGPIPARNVYSFPLFHIRTSYCESNNLLGSLARVNGCSLSSYIMNRVKLLYFKCACSRLSLSRQVT